MGKAEGKNLSGLDEASQAAARSSMLLLWGPE